MEEVDFAYIGILGNTIYVNCFQKFFAREFENYSKEVEAKWSEFFSKTEECFFFLIEQGHKNGFNVDEILEIPNKIGNTCFLGASYGCKNICNYIWQRDIRINNTDLGMYVPAFIYEDFTVQMMKKDVNPLVISAEETDRLHHHPSSFESDEAKCLLEKMPRSVHFSIEDIHCGNMCSPDCPSNYKRFYYKNGPLVEMTENNRIGEGGFGMVFRQSFHGKPMAMKCTFVEEWTDRKFNDMMLFEAFEALESSLSEHRIQIDSAGSGILAPVAFVRQQEQEKNENGKWIAMNFNIFIYPLYDCNLYELHENFYDKFTDDILKDICEQCLTRKK